MIGETGAQPGFAQQRDYDLTAAVPQGDKIVSALPDWSGRIWFASANGVVGYIEPASGAVHSLDTHEKIGNSFAVDETGGVYVVSDAAMYRFVPGPGGAPVASWRSTYPNDGTTKPGQTEVGSGTTPTVMTTGPYVAITDNADPIDIVVYRQATRALRCAPSPVFSKGASDTDQSLIAAGNALIAENNYGYSGPAATENGKTTTPGLERVDVNAGGSGCHKVWHSDEIAPTVVPKVSLANGLVYTYTKPADERRLRPLVPHGARLPQRQDRLQAAGGQRPRLQQQLRAGHARPRRHRLRRHARRPGGDQRRHARRRSCRRPARTAGARRRSCAWASGCATASAAAPAASAPSRPT